MRPALNDKYLSSLCTGLDVYRATNRLLRIFPFLEKNDIDIVYEESDVKRFTIMRTSYNKNTKKVLFTVASANPVRHLPSNYQGNVFLSNYLMIFQHLFNSTSITLDNIHQYFRPMECPPRFLPVIADWFGIHLDTLGGEDEVRRFLQYAIPLYKYRGTVAGLRAHLAIVAGVVPEIIEDEVPFTAMEILDGSLVESHIMERPADSCVFTVHFPIPRSKMKDELVQRLSIIVQQEKPVHARCFLSFEKKLSVRRKITVLTNDTMMSSDGGITI